MADVWLIRHAESAANAGMKTSDPHTIALTEHGWAQARALSAAFQRAPALIVVSPFLRTRQTAHATIARFDGVPVETWPIEEFTYLAPASCAHTTAAERRPRVAAYWQRGDPEYVDGPGAESFSGMLARVAQMLARLRALELPFCAVFAHGQIITAALLLLNADAGETPRELMRRFHAAELASPVANAQIIRLTL